MLLLTKYTVLYKENEICCIILRSLPSRERGLKYNQYLSVITVHNVAPFAGAWIEIDFLPKNIFELLVAPFAGAWIEITCALLLAVIGISSLPSRERGLKLFFYYIH